MKKILLIEKRKQAKKLHEENNWGVRKIARYVVANKCSVCKWINMSDEELEKDNRGWKKGKPRKYTEEQKKDIKRIRRQLEKEGDFFVGAPVVLDNYNKQHNADPISSIRFVDRTLQEAGLTKTPQTKRRGVSKYMNYPKRTLNNLGKCVMSADFIGPKYLKGGDEVSFLSCKYIRPNKKGIVRRVNGQTTDEAVRVLKEIWQTEPVPDVLQVDNDSAFGLVPLHEKTIGRFTLFLLNLGVKPLYIAPLSPWNNGSIEGHNSMFSKKFWNKIRFTDEDEIDVKIEDFNVAYRKYTDLINSNPQLENPKFMKDFEGVNLENKEVRKFKEHEIRFLRIARRKGEKGGKDEYGFIDVLKHEIDLPVKLINLFVYCVLDLKKKKLLCYTEKDGEGLKAVKKMDFKLKSVIY
ncbi:MAG: hypothetical protein A7316_10450 [Candidatus Altiarchaeales archaeon WOR_SM1_86-2]|nr:MAG: hypothetical protein A7316_10450 [Candidatus Altiarchaeales archaeon WOR_SM1_86-2]